MSQLTETRLGSLDGLRGLAALGVALVYHYQHFGVSAAHVQLVWRLPPPWPWLAQDGWLCVDLFFVLSGAVFTFKYGAALADRTVGGWEFAALRFSRLYPLYVLALVVVAAQQWHAARLYPYNDGYHFALTLAFLQGGAFERGYSFNGPAWSIAVEVVMYAVFYVLAAHARSWYAVAAATMLAAGAVMYSTNPGWPFCNELIARGLMGFFVGSLAFLAIKRARRARAFGWVAAAVVAAALLLQRQAVDTIGLLPFYSLVLFPAVIIAALTWPPIGRLLAWRPLTYLGDISYSVYLLHIPVQLAILGASERLGTDVGADRVIVFLGYALLVLGLAAASHRWLEVPAQRWLRRRLMGVQGDRGWRSSLREQRRPA